MTGLSDNIRIDSARLWGSLMEMAKIGPGVAGGNNRQTLTDADSEGRHLFRTWCESAGCTMGVDSMGNMFATRAGTDPAALPVYIGSHLDTQPTGGRFDGVLGVLAGLEVVRTMNDLGIRTKHPVVVTNWTNEEGARFAPAMLASGVFAGILTEDYAKARTDLDGKVFGEELARIGWVGDEKVGARKMHAMFEYHIEQGPILEAEGKEIGVVTHGQGLWWLEITLTGKDAHTGSTPMHMRVNAGLGMARITERVHQIAMSHQPNAVGAVGQVTVFPNSRNVIPGRVVFTVDVRSPEQAKLDTMRAEVERAAQAVARELGLGCSIEPVGHFDPVAFDAGLVKVVRGAAEKLGLSHMDIISGAGHDACWINRVAPTVMIMCPCVDGLSHNEAELISEDWAAKGADVLFHAVVETAGVVSCGEAGGAAPGPPGYLDHSESRFWGGAAMTTIIRNGTIVTADLSYKADVRIENGKISEIGPDLKGDRILDATGCYVMPGGIDPHTHLEMPFMGTYSTDDFESGTRAALAGGTTMVVDFVLPAPGQGLLDGLSMWHNKSGRANCDYSFHMAVTWWGEKVFQDMEPVVREHGITTFKHFMAYKGALMVNDDELYASFRRCAELGAIALVHAENGDVVAELQRKLLEEGNRGPEAHAYSRPPQVEGEATNRAIMIADMAGVPLYVVHTSCEEAHEAIRRARQQGKRVWGEPLIQHLTLDESEYFNPDWDHAARRVMSPPFRNKRHQDSLWAGLQSGSLSVVATDHCSFTTEQKRFGLDDFTKIPNGTGGLEDRMPMLWTQGVGTGRLTPNEFVAVTSTNIAKILNCYPRKGAVMVGADADLVVWDPEKEKVITAGTQQSAIDYNVFEGQRVKGLPRYTLSRGQVAVNDGRVETREGHGQFVKREANGSVNRALSAWKELTSPRPVSRSGIPATGV